MHVIQTQSTCTVHRQKNNFGQNKKKFSCTINKIEYNTACNSSNNDRIYKSSAQIKNEYWQMKNSETSKNNLKKGKSTHIHPSTTSQINFRQSPTYRKQLEVTYQTTKSRHLQHRIDESEQKLKRECEKNNQLKKER